VLTILGLFLGYTFAQTPGLDPQTAWTCLAIYVGVLAVDVIEFKGYMERRWGK
jgi:hypothetical protein